MRLARLLLPLVFVGCGAKANEVVADVVAPPEQSAKPAASVVEVEAPRRPKDLMVVIDSSGSMRGEVDAEKRTRFDVAKRAASELVVKAPGRAGALVFAADAFVLAPLTNDLSTVSKSIQGFQLGTLDGDGSAVGKALLSAMSKLRQVGAPSAVLVITDGNVDTSFEIKTIADLARQLQVTVTVLQISDSDRVSVAAGADIFGNPVRREQSFPIESKYLQALAFETNGEVVVATNPEAIASAVERFRRSLE